jgi:hypothetical protein
LKYPIFEFKIKSATFRIADTDPPLEEISVVGKGRYKHRVLTALYTTKMRPTGKPRDKEDGAGILYLEGNGRAAYKISGSIGSTRKWRELTKGTMTFGEDCTGSLKELKYLRASYVILVNSKGESETKVWRESALSIKGLRACSGHH